MPKKAKAKAKAKSKKQKKTFGSRLSAAERLALVTALANSPAFRKAFEDDAVKALKTLGIKASKKEVKDVALPSKKSARQALRAHFLSAEADVTSLASFDNTAPPKPCVTETMFRS
jgi:hypothetical protein